MEAIKDTIAFYLDNYIAEENKSRRELIKCWTEISEFPDYLVMPPYENLFTDDAVVLMNEEMIREIAMNKYNSRIQDGIWNAIGFVPLVGDILTIPDLIWNIHRGKEESEEQQLIMYDFCEDLRDEAINTYMTIIEEVCSQYCSLIENVAGFLDNAFDLTFGYVEDQSFDDINGVHRKQDIKNISPFLNI